MCLNRPDHKVSPLKAAAPMIAFLACFLLSAAFAHAGTLRVSLLLGDHNSRTAVEALKAITKEIDNLKAFPAGGLPTDDIRISVYPEKDIRKQDLTHLRESHLVIVLIMGRRLLNAVRPEIEEVIQRGGKVYGVGGYYDDEVKKMGLLFDPKLNAYFTTGIRENIRNMVLYALKGIPFGHSLWRVDRLRRWESTTAGRRRSLMISPPIRMPVPRGDRKAAKTKGPGSGSSFIGTVSNPDRPKRWMR